MTVNHKAILEVQVEWDCSHPNMLPSGELDAITSQVSSIIRDFFSYRYGDHGDIVKVNNVAVAAAKDTELPPSGVAANEVLARNLGQLRIDNNGRYRRLDGHFASREEINRWTMENEPPRSFYEEDDEEYEEVAPDPIDWNATIFNEPIIINTNATTTWNFVPVAEPEPVEEF